VRGLIANASLVGLFGTMLLITSHFFSDYRAVKVPSFKLVMVDVDHSYLSFCLHANEV
jgi:hypothetical protein